MKIKHKNRFTPVSSEQKIQIKRHRTLRFYFIFAVFFIILTAGGITAAIFTLLSLIDAFDANSGMFLPVSVALSCIIVGTGLAALISKNVMWRISTVSRGMSEVAKGNFKVRVEEKDKKSPSEFGELERSFNQMASDLEGIELFRNDFINNFSHEFKTPIVSIRGFARQLRSENLTDEEKKEYLDIIISQSERLASMSSNVLLLSKLESQTIVSERRLFELDEQIRNAILLLEKEWSEKDIELDIELDKVSYNFNEEMLSHVWINLVSNAIKFTDRGGKITCRLRQSDSEVIFEIADNGIGMSEETKNRIFEKFYQGDSSHSSIGNGIGLNIVHCIVSLASGRIEVESEQEKGSKFTVYLPK